MFDIVSYVTVVVPCFFVLLTVVGILFPFSLGMGQGIHKVPAHLLSPLSLPPKLHSLALNLIRVDHLTFDGGVMWYGHNLLNPFMR